MFRLEGQDRVHAGRLAVIWVIPSVIGIVAALQIHYPPYDNSVQGADQSKTMALMTVLAVPIFIGVVLMLVYSAIFFRRRGLELVDGPPMLGNTPVQVAWIGISAVVVLFLAVVGITTLASSSAAQAVGAGGRAIGQSGETGSSTALGARKSPARLLPSGPLTTARSKTRAAKPAGTAMAG